MMNLKTKGVLKDDNSISSVKSLLVKMIKVMAVINLLFYLASLIFGFSLKTLLGFLIGFLYVCLCYVYVARTVENAVEMTKDKAKRSVIACYVIRYVGLFVLCFIGLEFKIFNVVGIIIPQFYPKMALGVISFGDRKIRNKG